MLNNLDTYMCRVDGRPARIAVDLGLAADAPVLGLPYMAYVCVHLAKPDKDGLCSTGEASRLAAVEEALAQALHDNRTCFYVGNCVTDGQCDFIFYVADVSDWQQRVSGVMAGFPAYRWTAPVHEETRWNTYFTFLCPDPQEMEDVRINRLFRKLTADGYTTKGPCLIRHSLAFATRHDRDACCEDASQDGYAIQPLAQRSLNGNYILRLERGEQVDALAEVVLELTELAAANGGIYHGWEEVSEYAAPSCFQAI